MLNNISRFVFGEKTPGHLPERVQENIARQQQESEKLIGWVQLALVATFSTLYALSPKTGGLTMFQPVPWAISLYFLFTMIRLVAAYKNYLPGWLLIWSVVMDMGLLMFLIWSFHIQYEQPASFYLKAPTVMYVFIFIAIRALRFEPKYIMWAGMAAVFGWAGMVGYVVVADPNDPMITRDYVDYLTSNAVLVGAEIDKILSMIAVTLVLCVAVIRGQRILNRAVLDASAAKDLSRFVSREVAERITSADHAIQPGDGESRIATVVFTDIEGFSTVSEKLSPQQLARTLNAYFEATSKIIDAHGGVITQFQGDLMLITFNAVTRDDNHAVNAMKTAIGIRDLCAHQSFGDGGRLPTRCGVNTGEIVVGAIGSTDRLSFTVHGDQVNIAARLEQLNKQYGSYILAGENTVAACGQNFDFEEAGDVTVRGRAAATKIYTVRGERASIRASASSTKPVPASPLVT
ncbi:MAG: adenylate/guanylate cyclase domain-containing protein [Rhodospirillales bacterium]|nr:adenylate/guanylate cyclase domain-containing protein [Rhodospirillales bacterium]